MVPDGIFPWLSVTRSGSAWVMGPGGLLVPAAADTLREEFTAGGELLGWALERATENLLTRSEDFAAADWTKTDLTIGSAAASSPIDGVSADHLIEDETTGEHGAAQAFAAEADQACAYSVYLKAGDRTKALLRLSGDAFDTAQSARFDLLDGTAEAVSGAPGVQIVDVGDGWWRCVIVGVADNEDDALAEIVLIDDSGDASYAGDGESGIYATGAQLEAADHATSYVATTSAPASRGQDLVSLPLAGLVRPVGFTVVARFRVAQAMQAAPRCALALSNAGGSNEVVLGYALGGDDPTWLRDRVRAGGVEQYGEVAPVSLEAFATVTHAVSVAQGDIRAAWNGTLATPATAPALPTGLSTLHLGSRAGGADPLNGWLEAVAIYHGTRTNAWLEAATG